MRALLGQISLFFNKDHYHNAAFSFLFTLHSLERYKTWSAANAQLLPDAGPAGSGSAAANCFKNSNEFPESLAALSARVMCRKRESASRFSRKKGFDDRSIRQLSVLAAYVLTAGPHRGAPSEKERGEESAREKEQGCSAAPCPMI